MNRGYNVSDITPIIKVIWLHYSQFSHLYHGERQSLISKVIKTQNLECNRLSPLLFFLDFLMWNISRVLIEFATIMLLFCVLDFWPQGAWDPSSWDRTHIPRAMEDKVPGKSFLPHFYSNPLILQLLRPWMRTDPRFLVLRCESQGQGYREGYYAR